MLALTLLAAFGTERLGSITEPLERWGRTTVILVAVIAVVTNVTGLWMLSALHPQGTADDPRAEQRSDPGLHGSLDHAGG